MLEITSDFSEKLRIAHFVKCYMCALPAILKGFSHLNGSNDILHYDGM